MENENPFGNEPLHIPSEQTPSFEPDELGLDLSNEADLDLYNESKGIRQAAEVLLERRKLTEGYMSGQLSAEQYDLQLKVFNDTVQEILAEHEKEAP
jgi:hypothetical protein